MDALSLLRLQLEWGADEALGEAPIDRLHPVPAPARAPALAPVPGAPPPVDTPVERALRAAGKAGSLDALKAAIAGFDGCALRDMATNPVFASGDPDSDLLLIGGAPGADEDRAGSPFAGLEGALLDQMLGSVGLKREAMLLAPLIPWRPPGGRVPTPGEIQLCRPFLMRLIALAAPRMIVVFGALTAGTVLGTRPRGRSIGWVEIAIEGRDTQVLVFPALADIRKTAARRKEAWTGLRLLRRALETDRKQK